MAWVPANPANDELLINFPAQARANWDALALGTDANLLITNAKCHASMGLVDTKLAQITTASKVSGAAITLLPNVPGAAGALPVANIPNLAASKITSGQLTIARGGTNLSSAGAVANRVMITTDGSVFSVGQVALASMVSGTLAIARGGTNMTGYTQGDILYCSSTNVLSKLAKGSSGKVLKMGASVPAWELINISQGDLNTATGEVSISEAHNIGSTESWIMSALGNINVALDFVRIDIGSSYVTKIALYVRAPNGNQNVGFFTLPGGNYGFYPQIKTVGIVTTSSTSYALQRYITASGHDHWVFLLVDKATRNIIAGYQAPDHPSANQGGAIEIEIPHPFGSYDPTKHEIVIVDNVDLLTMKQRVTRKKSLLQIINEDFRIDDTKRPVWTPREIIKIDEYGDMEGEIIKTLKTPEWAKIMIGAPEITLKRRMVEKLPDNILFKKMRLK